MLISAAVLAAGRSSRMGRDKALLEMSGLPMWQRQMQLASQLQPVEILLSCRPDQEIATADAKTGDFRLIHDEIPNCGPLGGIVTALRAMRGEVLLVLAVDLPCLTVEPLAFLLKHSSSASGAVLAHGDAFHEPLVATYPRHFLPLAEKRLAERRLALQPLILEAIANNLLTSHPIPQAWTDQFANWNHPDAPQPVHSAMSPT